MEVKKEVTGSFSETTCGTVDLSNVKQESCSDLEELEDDSSMAFQYETDESLQTSLSKSNGLLHSSDEDYASSDDTSFDTDTENAIGLMLLNEKAGLSVNTYTEGLGIKLETESEPELAELSQSLEDSYTLCVKNSSFNNATDNKISQTGSNEDGSSVNTHTGVGTVEAVLSGEEVHDHEAPHVDAVSENQKIFSCKICGKRFARKEYVMTHIRIVHEGRKKFSCFKCGKKFAGRHYLRKHLMTIHIGQRIGIVECDVSSEEPAAESSLVQRMGTILDGGTKFSCNICGKIYAHKCSLWTHLRTIHQGSSYSCYVCGKNFNRKNSLSTHLRSVHAPAKNHDCEVCGKSFSLKHHLNDHLRRVHYGEKNFTCDVCGKPFFDQSTLTVHLRSVHKGEKLQCDICGRKFGRPSDLAFHVRTFHNGTDPEETIPNKTDHDTEPNLKCDICWKPFSHKGSLAEHLKVVHEGEKSFHCDVCGKEFGAKRSMMRHRKTIHDGEKSFSCDACDKKFAEKGNLTKHRRTVHERLRNHDCPDCGKKFAQKPDLRRHFRRIHEKKKKLRPSEEVRPEN